ncbi:serine/threonine-protein phosphatase [Shimia sp. R10_1]|uniref:PP2C family protein-serine/threonine phosphatase n=1 Tax=Shimia sp. R10_1 TaxID=2821095 RepID=UPI001ADCF1D1|nr:protein phosphatase 2C domain-containing protein [Shimia sp. R10_1]MBO9474212.1 serine/threonine-protein phosphatase [Shimia sp. R10_1]
MVELCFDVATGLSLGARDRQEDSVVADFPLGAPVGFAVLSDGMGGHACGDMASGIVATEMFSELKLLAAAPAQMEHDIGVILRDAVTAANRCIHLYEAQNGAAQGMGATLVAPVLFENRLYWVSVGDSPLYLFRGQKLYRLNEDHSFAAYVDGLRARGEISQDEADNHPDRSALISVLAGGKIARVDCRTVPTLLNDGDIVLAASDGLHTLSDAALTEILCAHAQRSGAQIGDAILRAVEAVGCPDQDNLSLCVIKAVRATEATLSTPQAQPQQTRHTESAQIGGVESKTVVQIDRDARNGVQRSVLTLIRKVAK